MSKTGGGKGTNQYAIKGVSQEAPKASAAVTAVAAPAGTARHNTMTATHALQAAHSGNEALARNAHALMNAVSDAHGSLAGASASALEIRSFLDGLNGGPGMIHQQAPGHISAAAARADADVASVRALLDAVQSDGASAEEVSAVLGAPGLHYAPRQKPEAIDAPQDSFSAFAAIEKAHSGNAAIGRTTQALMFELNALHASIDRMDQRARGTRHNVDTANLSDERGGQLGFAAGEVESHLASVRSLSVALDAMGVTPDELASMYAARA